MKLSCLPRLLLPTLTALTPELLTQRGIRLLMLDFDNTIVPYTTDVPTPAMQTWLRQMTDAGIQLCVVSNSKKPRVRTFCKTYDLPVITHARKPSPRALRACLARFQVAPAQAALAGDQIYTDVLGANLAGVYPVLVRAIDNHTIWLKLRHVAELPFCFAARRRKLPCTKI